MTNSLVQHPAFQALLNYAQFAKQGDREDAWKLKAMDFPEQEAIVNYLNEAEEVAFEVFFGDAFFGVRFRGTAEDVRRGAFACVKAYHSHSVNAPIFSTLSKLLDVPTWGQTV